MGNKSKGLLPRIHQYEYIVGAYAKYNEYREKLHESHVFHLKDERVGKNRCRYGEENLRYPHGREEETLNVHPEPKVYKS